MLYRFGLALLAFTAFNVLLLLSILYWFVFDNSTPPFIAGRPVSDVAFALGGMSLCTSYFGALLVLFHKPKEK